MIVRARHPDHRHDAEPARRGDLRLDGFDANPAVLGIEQHEIGPRFGQNRHQPRGEELEGRRAVSGAAGAKPSGDRIGPHQRSHPVALGS